MCLEHENPSQLYPTHRSPKTKVQGLDNMHNGGNKSFQRGLEKELPVQHQWKDKSDSDHISDEDLDTSDQWHGTYCRCQL